MTATETKEQESPISVEEPIEVPGPKEEAPPVEVEPVEVPALEEEIDQGPLTPSSQEDVTVVHSGPHKVVITASEETLELTTSSSEEQVDVVAVAAPKVPATKPQFLSITVTKSNPSESVGVGLSKNESGHVCLKKISGLLAAANRDDLVHVGDKVLSINGVDIKGKDTKFCADLIRSSKSTVSIQFEAVGDGLASNMACALISKPSGDAKIGVAINTIDNVLQITRAGGLVEHCILSKGDKIVSIDGKDTVGMSSRDAIGLIKEADGVFTIMVERA